jgi:hypothetical protein
MVRLNGPFGAGSQLACFSPPGSRSPRCSFITLGGSRSTSCRVRCYTAEPSICGWFSAICDAQSRCVVVLSHPKVTTTRENQLVLGLHLAGLRGRVPRLIQFILQIAGAVARSGGRLIIPTSCIGGAFSSAGASTARGTASAAASTARGTASAAASTTRGTASAAASTARGTPSVAPTHRRPRLRSVMYRRPSAIYRSSTGVLGRQPGPRPKAEFE